MDHTERPSPLMVLQRNARLAAQLGFEISEIPFGSNQSSEVRTAWALLSRDQKKCFDLKNCLFAFVQSLVGYQQRRWCVLVCCAIASTTS